MKSKLAVVAMVLALVPLAAQADTIRYTYLGLGFATLNDPPKTRLGADTAYELYGSYALPNNFVVGGQYEHEKANINLLPSPWVDNLSRAYYLAGVGYRIPFTSRLIPFASSLELVPSLYYQSIDGHVTSTSGKTSQSDSGYEADFLLRAMVMQKLEADAEYAFIHAGGATNRYSVAGYYDFLSNMAVGLRYDTADSADVITNSWTLTFRYYFH